MIASCEWAAKELAHREARDAESRQPSRSRTPSFHDGQRQLAESVYRAVKAGRCLLAQAPTGHRQDRCGTIFPVLKAMSAEKIDKLFFLVAKTSGRRLALEFAIATLRSRHPHMRLRVLELVARDKACEYPQNAVFRRLVSAGQGLLRSPSSSPRRSAAACSDLDQKTLREIALDTRSARTTSSQEMARWSDVIVGDYNYYFDSSALLYAFTVLNDWRVVLLADESHNLIERGRAMYTASLNARS